MKQNRTNILAVRAEQLAAGYLAAGDDGAGFISSTPIFASYPRHLDYRFAEK